MHDCAEAEAVLENHQAGAILADKGYDSDALIAHIEASGAAAVIPPKANRKTQRPCDYALYRDRRLIENFFQKLKQFRGIATRYDKRATHFLSGIHLAASVILLN